AMIFGLTDHFRTYNLYAGGQAGLRGWLSFRRPTGGGRGVAGLGGNQGEGRGVGGRGGAGPGRRAGTGLRPAGAARHRGRFIQGDLDWVGEVGLNVGYQLTHWARVFAGYTFLYWDAPLRSGDQIDTTINRSQLGPAPQGPRRPVIPFKEDALWAQGVN